MLVGCMRISDEARRSTFRKEDEKGIAVLYHTLLARILLLMAVP